VLIISAGNQLSDIARRLEKSEEEDSSTQMDKESIVLIGMYA